MPTTFTTKIQSATNVSATYPSEGTVDITWTNNTSNSEATHDVERSFDGGSTYTDVATGLSNTTTSYTDTTTSLSTDYLYRIETNTTDATTTSTTASVTTGFNIFIDGDQVLEIEIDDTPVTAVEIDNTQI